MKDLFKSKTNVQILVSAFLAAILIGTGIAVEVLFDKGVFDYVALGIGNLLGNNGIAAYRNVKADVPVRVMEAQTNQANAMVDIAAKAKHEGVELPPVWKAPQ